MPAGAMPMPLRPNTTVTGLETVAPSFGEMMYASAPGGEGVRSCANASDDPSNTAAMKTARMKAPFSNSHEAKESDGHQYQQRAGHIGHAQRNELRACEPFS